MGDLSSDVGRAATRRSPRSSGRGILALAIAFGFGTGYWAAGRSVDSEDPPGSSVEFKEQFLEAAEEISTFERARALVGVLSFLDETNVEEAALALRGNAMYLDPTTAQLFLSAWARFDAIGALEEARSWPADAPREMGMRTVMREWAGGGSTVEASLYYHQLADAKTQALLLGPLLRGWAATGDVSGAFRQARVAWAQEENPSAAVDGFVRGAIAALGAAKTAEWLAEQDPIEMTGFEERTFRTALQLIARETPDAAAALYDRLAQREKEQPAWLGGVAAAIAGSWASEEPRATLEWLLGHPPTAERTGALESAMSQWARADLDAAWAWWQEEYARAREVGEERTELRRTLLKPALTTLARVRPAEAAQWLERVEPEESRRVLRRRTAYFWTSQDPEAARRWAARLPLSEDEAAEIEAAMRRAQSRRVAE
jgi:hypothetical protein